MAGSNNRSKYAVFIDTNIFDGGDKDRGFYKLEEKVKSILSFAKENNLDIDMCLPEIALGEYVVRKVMGLGKSSKKVSYWKKELGHISTKLKSKLENVNMDLSVDELRQEIITWVKSLGVNIVGTPRVKLNELINRALNYLPPFSDKDRGFKDTLIYYTILEYAKGHRDREIIFLTNDFVFLDKSTFSRMYNEFKNITSKGLTVFNDVLGLKVFLNEKESLGLRLGESYKEIHQKLKDHIGDILVYINSNLDKYFSNVAVISFDPPISLYSIDSIYPNYPLSSTNKSNYIPVAFLFHHIEIKDIKKNNGILLISAYIWGHAKFKRENYDTQTTHVNNYLGLGLYNTPTDDFYDEDNVSLKVELEYNTNGDSIKITGPF